MKNNETYPTHETLSTHAHHHLICWKSTVAGILVAFMTYLLLSSLGFALTGMSAQSAIDNETGGLLVLSGAGLWMGISAAVSLFIGSFFALRVSRYVTDKVGFIHGVVIASVFFIIMTFLAGGAVSGIARGLAGVAQGAGMGASELMKNPMVQDTINKSMSTNNLKSPAPEVAQGLALRLLQGDTTSAKSYYAYQTGLSESEVNAKVDQLAVEFKAAAKKAADKAAEAVTAIGWMLTALFLAGVAAGAIGGMAGARSNIRMPFASHVHEDGSPVFKRNVLANQNGSAGPYILGWLLGVPTSILFLIFLLRAIF